MPGYGRLLYGYQMDGSENHKRGRVRVDPDAMMVVAAILNAPSGSIRSIASHLSKLMPGTCTAKARMMRVQRIRDQEAWYRIGKARRDLDPSPALAVPEYAPSDMTLATHP